MGVGTVVGRERELAAVESFFTDSCGGRGLLVEGPAGIGKTSVWQAGLAEAAGRGNRLLVCVADRAESDLSFVGLGDLLADHADEGLSALPVPQRTALEIALLRTEPADAPPGQRAIALGLLNVLRTLAARKPLVVAVDDVQWLDRPSAEALAFAARRLREEKVALFVTRRAGTTSVFDRVAETLAWATLEIGPLSLGAARRILTQRLGINLPRRVVRQVFEATEGNPLFLLEVGRTLVGRDPPPIGEELTIPPRVEDLLGTRVAELSDPERRLLLTLALSGDMPRSQLESFAGTSVVRKSIRNGLLILDGDRFRPAHPLLATAAIAGSVEGERRAVHRDLANVAADPALRARHLALAAEGPDEELAAEVASAAAGASRRGAAQEAVILAEHALRLTPATSRAHGDRVLAVGESLLVAGELQRMTQLLVPALETLPPGPARVRACLLLCEDVDTLGEAMGYFERALEESRDHPGQRALVLAEMSGATGCVAVERVEEAEAWALEALEIARRSAPELERDLLHSVAWGLAFRGRPVEDVCDRFRELSDAHPFIGTSPERVAGQRLAWRGEVEQARAVLTRLLSSADERGESVAYLLVLLNLCQLELRAGEWETASQRLDDMAESGERELLLAPGYERCMALLAAGRGFASDAERWGKETIALAEASGIGWERLDGLHACGIAALLAGEPVRAAESLRPVWQQTVREGVEEPGVFPVVPDLVEALVELGEFDEARAVIDRLRVLSERQQHPWGMATARRCTGLVGLSAGGYDESAAAELVGASSDYDALGLRFDRARSLLALGRAQRRHRKWRAARESLEQTTRAFDELDSPGWVDKARSELARVGGRHPTARGKLTHAERRCVDLAAEGLSNKEIARTLFVTVNTVEVHLSHAYAKLGVHSRGQLARRLSA